MDLNAERLTKKLADWCQRNSVQELAVFGSALTSRFSEASDVDFLITFKPETRVGFLTLARAQRELTDILGRKVDLVPKSGLKPTIRDAVLSSAQILYAA